MDPDEPEDPDEPVEPDDPEEPAEELLPVLDPPEVLEPEDCDPASDDTELTLLLDEPLQKSGWGTQSFFSLSNVQSPPSELHVNSSHTG